MSLPAAHSRGPLTTPTNIAATLTREARLRGNEIALRCPGTRGADGFANYDVTLTFAELDRRSDLIARGLGAVGLAPRMRAVLMVRPSPEFFLLMFALFKAGAVPVLVDPGIDRRALRACLGEAEPHAFIGIAIAQAARTLLRWAPTATLKVWVGRGGIGGPTLAEVEALGHLIVEDLPTPSADDIAAILFTSGATGVPKGVVYRHRHFLAQIDMLRGAFGLEPGGVDLPTFPPFALFDPALGLTSVIPDMDPSRPARANPARLLHAIERFGVTQLFGSPAVLEVLVRHNAELRGVARVLSAGAPVPAQTVAAMRDLLPRTAQLWTPYGATECLPVAVIEGRELEATRSATERGAGTCVGRVVEPNVVRIVAIEEGPIEQWHDGLVREAGVVGEITVAGPSATDTYFNRPAATRLAKVRETLADGSTRIVHRMGDVGYFDTRGQLWFCGRMMQRVRTSAGELYTEQVEPIFNTIEGVRRSALVGIPMSDLRAAAISRPVMVLQLQPGARRADKLRVEEAAHALAARFEHTRTIVDVAFHPALPMDTRHNAKIDRAKVARWAARRLARTTIP